MGCETGDERGPGAVPTTSVGGCAMSDACRRHGLSVLLLCLCVLGFRGMLMGHAPFTDEGHYVAIAYHVWNFERGTESPIQYIPHANLYPRLLSWLFAFDRSCILLFRMADALIMAGGLVVLYALLCRVAGHGAALVLCLLWFLCSNHPLFINAGFKNAFAPGFACVMGALLLVVERVSARRSYAAGVLLGIAALLREPLVVYFAPVLAYVWFRHSLAEVRRVVLGGAVCVVGVIMGIGLVEGVGAFGVFGCLWRNYRQSSVMYAHMVQALGIDLKAHRALQFRLTLDAIGWSIPFWAVGGILAGVAAWKNPTRRATVLAGCCLVLVPLPEFLLKLGFPYHLSAALAGCVLLAAVGLSGLSTRTWVGGALVLLVGGILMVPGAKAGTSSRYWWREVCHGVRESRHFAPFILHEDWNSPVVRESYYLAAAAIIRANSSAEDRLLVSGLCTALYPLSRRRPTTLAMTDLSMYLMTKGFDLGSEGRGLLEQRPPQVFVESNRVAGLDLKACFPRFGERFEDVGHVDVGRRSYDRFACRVWREKRGPAASSGGVSVRPPSSQK